MPRHELEVETYTYKNCKIVISYDDSVTENPRNDYEHSSMLFIAGSRNCTDIDEISSKNPVYIWQRGKEFSVEEPGDDPDNEEYWEEVSIVKTSDFSSWDELEEAVKALYPECLLLSVYKYEHSGVCYNTTGFSCPWDSGQVGYIFVTKETIQEEWDGDREKAEKCLVGEIKEFSGWANGEIYCFYIYVRPESYVASDNEDDDDTDWELFDCCGGYYDLDYCKDTVTAIIDTM